MDLVTVVSASGALDHLLPRDLGQPNATGSVNSVFVQLKDSDGNEAGSPVWLPLSINTTRLTALVKELVEKDEDDPARYDFYVGDIQLLDDLETALIQSRAKGADPEVPQYGATGLESVVQVVYQEQAVFRVRPVTRCTSTLPGHKGAVLVAQFSPDARCLATGSGDQTVRFWDLSTELPATTGTDAHHAPVLCLAWSPDGLRLASGCQGGVVCLWEESDSVKGLWSMCTGKPLIRPTLVKSPTASRGRWIRSLVWRPFHLDPDCRKLVVAYQDTSMVIWDSWTGQPLLTLNGHEKPVVCVRWGGTDLLYSASQDRTIRVWRSDDGILCRTLSMHGHWVNCLALSTDYVLRTGPFDPAEAQLIKCAPPKKSDKMKREELQKQATELYGKIRGAGSERLVAGSDDNTLSLWQPELDKKPLAPRMVGHQGVVNDVKFSRDARMIASASFDHSVKIWDGHTGQFLATLFGHVQEVYLVAWSSDSRLLVSCSKDSTLKLWSLDEVRRWNQEAATVPKSERKQQLFAADVVGGKKAKGSNTNAAAHQRRRHLLHDLPGHADAVYALDWSPDGQRVASGGKDRVLKIWRA
ncbi:Notchless protein 1 [Fasciola hepatica]|uniref:Notchless protein 1 n=1 Tax=Fasciola hepatica TaxID=6192 RepID=A0A4E0RD44_FASHE|nr:Notchless protein 1 [Fasciola hepatica]